MSPDQSYHWKLQLRYDNKLSSFSFISFCEGRNATNRKTPCLSTLWILTVIFIRIIKTYKQQKRNICRQSDADRIWLYNSRNPGHLRWRLVWKWRQVIPHLISCCTNYVEAHGITAQGDARNYGTRGHIKMWTAKGCINNKDGLLRGNLRMAAATIYGWPSIFDDLLDGGYNLGRYYFDMTYQQN